MPDDKKIKEPADGNKVNVNEPYEVNYWTKKWGVTEAQLRACVSKVGSGKDAVAKCLGK